MIAQPQKPALPELIYPDSDGKPMSDNTKQFRWIVTIKENLEILFADRADVFVAGDLLWYPVDAMVAFGRPKGDRGSYQQWKENNIAPQVVFEILSPCNSAREMKEKRGFYERYGVQEYYQYDPDRNKVLGFERIAEKLVEIPTMNGWVSPRLGIRFDCLAETLVIYGPDGQRFLTPVEMAQQRTLERQRADTERERANTECERAERLAQKLKELGINPEDI
jgi:Uma2 family endonuclease